MQKELQERKGTWFAIVSGLLYSLLGYFGVALMNSGFSIFVLSFWRFFFAFLLAAVSYAIYLFVSKRLEIEPLDSTLLVSLGCAIFGLIAGFADGNIMVPSGMNQWLLLLGLTVISTAAPILLMLEALKYISSDK